MSLSKDKEPAVNGQLDISNVSAVAINGRHISVDVGSFKMLPDFPLVVEDDEFSLTRSENGDGDVSWTHGGNLFVSSLDNIEYLVFTMHPGVTQPHE